MRITGHCAKGHESEYKAEHNDDPGHVVLHRTQISTPPMSDLSHKLLTPPWNSKTFARPDRVKATRKSPS